MNHYSASISDFLNTPNETICGILLGASSNDINRLQSRAWDEEISILKRVLPKYPNGKIIFEYTIPRLGRRIDTVLLINSGIIVLEFKTADTDVYSHSAEDQVLNYAFELNYFHEYSHKHIIVPLLVAANAPTRNEDFELLEENVYSIGHANYSSLADILQKAVAILPCTSEDEDWFDKWENGKYVPTPTIIEAAARLFDEHTVSAINFNTAEKNLRETEKCIRGIINKSKKQEKKSICFVTGVPGAGKTLVGLHVINQCRQKGEHAVFLSGNYPLVKVLRAALVEDRCSKINPATNKPYAKGKVIDEVESFIQLISKYREKSFEKIKLPIHGKLEVDTSKVEHREGVGYAEIEPIAIFDEAQRAWNNDQLRRKLPNNLADSGFDFSEPYFLLWSMDLHEKWACVVCLIGGGQDINSGEAGIEEWINALASETFKGWEVYISDKLHSAVYSDSIYDTLNKRQIKPHIDNRLNLTASTRSLRSDKVNDFVDAILERNISKSSRLYKAIGRKYPIYLTRSVDAAKSWMRGQVTEDSGLRCGLVASSYAKRLKAIGYEIKSERNVEVEEWFLKNSTNIKSSNFLEEAVSEFIVQGLEVDYAGVIWDADFRYEGEQWGQYKFSNGEEWQPNNNETKRRYQFNAYRVLLTRARRGMVIIVPEGDQEDSSGHIDNSRKNTMIARTII